MVNCAPDVLCNPEICVLCRKLEAYVVLPRLLGACDGLTNKYICFQIALLGHTKSCLSYDHNVTLFLAALEVDLISETILFCSK